MKRMTVIRFFSLPLLLAVILTVVTCKKKSPTGSDEPGHESWFPPSLNLTFQYMAYETPSISFTGTAKVLGLDNETYPGNTYVKIQIGDFEGVEKRGCIIWLDLSTVDKIGYKAAEVYWADVVTGTLPSSIAGDRLSMRSHRNVRKAKDKQVEDWDLLEVYDPPMYVKYDGTTGQVKSSEKVDATYYFLGDYNDYITFKMRAEYMFSSNNATVTVPYGTVDNCIQMNANFWEIVDSDSFSFSGTYYMRPDIGVVYAEPFPGYYKAELISGNAITKLLSKILY